MAARTKRNSISPPNTPLTLSSSKVPRRGDARIELVHSASQLLCPSQLNVHFRWYFLMGAVLHTRPRCQMLPRRCTLHSEEAKKGSPYGSHLRIQTRCRKRSRQMKCVPPNSSSVSNNGRRTGWGNEGSDRTKARAQRQKGPSWGFCSMQKRVAGRAHGVWQNSVDPSVGEKDQGRRRDWPAPFHERPRRRRTSTNEST